MNKYTNSQWDREIGWGKCPDEYRYKPLSEVNMHRIQSLRSLRDEMKAVVRGERAASANAAKLSFNSVDAVKKDGKKSKDYKTKTGQAILEGARESLAYARGEADESRFAATVVVPVAIDVLYERAAKMASERAYHGLAGKIRALKEKDDG